MLSVDERLTEQFLAWEIRGRGWQLWDSPVHPEPPFRPFLGHFLPQEAIIDDGRRPTVLGGLTERLWRAVAGVNGRVTEPPEEEEPQAEAFMRSAVKSIEVRLPFGVSLSHEEWAYFFASLSLASEPLAFELIADERTLSIQFTAAQADISMVRRQVEAFFPGVSVIPGKDTLRETWEGQGTRHAAVVDFGLEKEFMLTLSVGKADPFMPLLGVLEGLGAGELGVYQIVFDPVHAPWAESVIRSVSDASGEPFFDNAPELLSGAKEKICRPLYSVSMRLAAKSEQSARTIAILREMAGAMRVFDNPSGNSLIPLSNQEYPYHSHEEDLLRRETRRSGMILNADELAGLVHLPGEGVASGKLFGRAGKTKAAPAEACNADGLVLGVNTHLGVAVPVSLTADERVNHVHVIGASGTGKSTLLYNLIVQDVKVGRGVAVLDPHGDLVDRILGSIPEERVGDVILVDPSDMEYPVGFNILFAHSEVEKTLLSSDLVSVFRRLSDSWGDQMGSVLQNAILAFLESERGGSLADLRRFLLEPAHRDEFLETVRDPEVVYYWKYAFPQLSGNRSIGPVLTRLEGFLAPKSIRYMVSQPKNRIDFADVLDSGKILLAKLAQGLVGKENSYLLGTLLVSKLQETAMARQAKTESARRDFFVYVDECHNFITPSMAEILTGARKYRLGLVLAHQELRQLDRAGDVAAALLTNPYTRICFRVNDRDAATFASGFSSFDAKDLQNLGTGEAICRIGRRDRDFNLTVTIPEYPDAEAALGRRRQVMESSRAKYATPRAEVEEALGQLRRETPAPPPKSTSPAEAPPPVRKPTEPPAMDFRPPPVPPAPPPKAPESPPERETAPSRPVIPDAPKPAPVRPATPGRGGQEHKHLQALIKQWADGMGWRASVEKEVLGGKGSVDVALEKGERRIACEVSITTDAEQETGNVKKCVAAGFGHVFLICADRPRAEKMKVAVSAGLSAAEAAKTRFGVVDDLFAFVQEMAAADASGERTVRGYKVKVQYRALDPNERAEKEKAISQAVVKSLRKPRTTGEKAGDKRATK